MTEKPVPDDAVNQASDIFNSVSSANRLYTFLNIGNKTPMQIAEDLDLSRSALQYYLDDWKELGLISIEGNDYYYTGEGVEILTQLNEIVDNLED